MMQDKDLNKIVEIIEKTIQTTVNGKIDRLHKKLEEESKLNESHRALMQPVYDAYNTANKTGSFVIWLSKIILAISIVIGSIVAFIKTFIK